MAQVVVSPDYQIEFPPDFIRKYNIRPGNRYSVDLSGECIRFMNAPNIKNLRGTLKMSDWSDVRDERDRVL